MSNPIPLESREAVRSRDFERCQRCALAGTDWHHRRPRREGEHRHSPMNGVLLCRRCHDWAHSHPRDARRLGYIVSRSIDSEMVWTVPVKTYQGWLLFMPNATIRFVSMLGPEPTDAHDWAISHHTALSRKEGDPLAEPR